MNPTSRRTGNGSINTAPAPRGYQPGHVRPATQVHRGTNGCVLGDRGRQSTARMCKVAPQPSRRTRRSTLEHGLVSSRGGDADTPGAVPTATITHPSAASGGPAARIFRRRRGRCSIGTGVGPSQVARPELRARRPALVTSTPASKQGSAVGPRPRLRSPPALRGDSAMVPPATSRGRRCPGARHGPVSSSESPRWTRAARVPGDGRLGDTPVPTHDPARIPTAGPAHASRRLTPRLFLRAPDPGVLVSRDPRRSRKPTRGIYRQRSAGATADHP